ncbi:MAG TPA: iron ABC transporter permease [Chromobacteriaceae bacterium]|nr:iron ABC transporter permease [Chromobacteriaceae bacterium]
MRTIPLVIVLTTLLLVTSLMSLLSGSELSASSVLFGQPWPALEQTLLLQLRLPRLLLALSAGALLATAGAAVQARFRNPLAEPGLVGINSGAALAAALAIHAGGGMLMVSLAAFVGGMLALWGVRLLGQAHQGGSRLILAGLAISTLLGSLLTLLISTLPDGSLRTVTFWLMGSFANADWPTTTLLLGAMPLIWLALFRQWRFLNALQLGESAAFHLGFAVQREEWRIVLLAAMAAGLVVSGCGMVGFVGLMAPHIARQLVGGDARRLLQVAPLLGALLTVLADWAAHSLLAPAELPVGIITSLIGAPFFLWLLHRLPAGASHD